MQKENNSVNQQENINEIYSKNLKRKRLPYEISTLDQDLKIISAGTKKLKISNDNFINKQVCNLGEDLYDNSIFKNKIRLEKKTPIKILKANKTNNKNLPKNKIHSEVLQPHNFNKNDVTIKDECLNLLDKAEIFLDIEHSNKVIKSAIDMEKLQINYFKVDHPSLVPSNK